MYSFIVKANQLVLAATLAAAIGAPYDVVASDKNVVQKTTPSAVKLPIEGELPSLGSATGWLNSQPLTTAGLRGKVVLVDFWTYTCINWLRSLPMSARGPRNTRIKVGQKEVQVTECRTGNNCK